MALLPPGLLAATLRTPSPPACGLYSAMDSTLGQSRWRGAELWAGLTGCSWAGVCGWPGHAPRPLIVRDADHVCTSPMLLCSLGAGPVVCGSFPTVHSCHRGGGIRPREGQPCLGPRTKETEAQLCQAGSTSGGEWCQPFQCSQPHPGAAGHAVWEAFVLGCVRFQG